MSEWHFREGNETQWLSSTNFVRDSEWRLTWRYVDNYWTISNNSGNQNNDTRILHVSLDFALSSAEIYINTTTLNKKKTWHVLYSNASWLNILYAPMRNKTIFSNTEHQRSKFTDLSHRSNVDAPGRTGIWACIVPEIVRHLAGVQQKNSRRRRPLREKHVVKHGHIDHVVLGDAPRTFMDAKRIEGAMV